MTHTQLTQLVQALLDARTSNPTVKEFAQSWLDAEGTPKQEELTKQLVSVAEQNIALIDETIGFAGSDLAKQMLGAEVAAQLLQHAKDIKAKGSLKGAFFYMLTNLYLYIITLSLTIFKNFSFIAYSTLLNK